MFDIMLVLIGSMHMNRKGWIKKNSILVDCINFLMVSYLGEFFALRNSLFRVLRTGDHIDSETEELLCKVQFFIFQKISFLADGSALHSHAAMTDSFKNA